jgi:hypothetical protein
MSQIRAAVQNQLRFMLFARTFLTGLCSVSSGLLALRRGRNRKGQAMSTKTTKNAMALGAAAILGVAGPVVITPASPSWAMPVLSGTAAVRTAASNQITDVRYYRHRYYRHRYYGRGDYGRGYYGRGYYRRGYGYPWWGDPYAYAYPYSYPYAFSYPYRYFYSYSFPFGWDWGWSWGGW